MTVEDARYSYSSDKNRLLLLALAEAWGSNCYWCRKPKTFRDLQIDHILPLNPRGGADPNFDVDAAANLAPICGPCNQEKGNGKFEEAPRFDAARKRATDLAPAVQRNLARFRKDATVVKALLAVTAADLDSEDVAESVESFGALILPVFRERFPQILDAPYTKDYTIRRPPVEFHGRAVQLPEERSVVELDGPGQRALVILEDVLRIQMDDAIDDVRRSIADDIEEQVDRWLHNGMDGRYASVHRDERPSSTPIGIFVSDLRYADGGVVLSGEFDGTFIAEVEEYDPDPERWSTHRKADFDFVGDFAATFSSDGVTDLWVVTAEPDENEWRGRASMMQFYDE